MRILIVEDNETSAMVLAGILSKSHHETVRAGNGREALEKLSLDTAFDLIFSDIAMPEMDGLTLLKTMREDPRFCDIPVIMCTALADAERIKEAVQLGCADYVVKPVHAGAVLEKIRKAVTHERAVITPDGEIVKRYGMGWVAYAKIRSSFCDLLAQQATLLERQAKSSEAEAAAPKLSQLLESATAFGADRLAHVVNQMLIREETTRAAGTPGDGGPDYTGLLDQINRVLQSLHDNQDRQLQFLKIQSTNDGEAPEPENGE